MSLIDVKELQKIVKKYKKDKKESYDKHSDVIFQYLNYAISIYACMGEEEVKYDKGNFKNLFSYNKLGEFNKDFLLWLSEKLEEKGFDTYVDIEHEWILIRWHENEKAEEFCDE